jgi:hypothetical protein
LLRSGKLTWHYVIVAGYTETHIELVDPAGGRRYKTPNANFVGAWKFQTDMNGNWMEGTMADLLLFLVKSTEAKTQTMIVPLNSIHSN